MSAAAAVAAAFEEVDVVDCIGSGIEVAVPAAEEVDVVVCAGMVV